MALLLCHMIPAVCEPALRSFLSSMIGRVLRWPIGAWFCIGAMASLWQMTHVTGSMLALPRNPPHWNQPAWDWMAPALAAISAVISLIAAWNNRLRCAAIVSLSVGLCISLAALLAQSSGLQRSNPLMDRETGLDDAFRVASGMLSSAMPAAILALRIGRMGLSMRQLVWTGLWGVWLPLLTSVALVSIAKMCGVRLYWKPSLPVEFLWAFAWLPKITSRHMPLLWPLAVTFLAPCVVCAIWIVDFTRDWEWSWPKLAAWAAIAAAGFALTSSELGSLYYRHWLDSTAVACLLLGLAHLIRSLITTISAKLRGL
jgi:hypothetical protein